MPTEKKSLTSEFSTTVQASRKAGEAVLGICNSNFSTALKEDKEPVTEADIKSNEIIQEIISSFGYPVLSEESVDNSDRVKSKRVWIIDPLDGTSDFVNKTGEFSIMIGLVREGKPVLGIVYAPAKDIMYYAAAGQGAFVKKGDGRAYPLRVSGEDDFKKVKMFVSRHHLQEREVNLAKKLNIKDMIAYGSAGLKICLIAGGKGEMNINTSDRTHEWDICAADIILKEAGGKLTDMNGKEFIYNKKNPVNPYGYVATNGEIHDVIIDELSLVTSNQ